MSRTARLVIPEVPYHITHRGNNREQIFFYDTDYKKYLELLREHSRQVDLTILGYCLMPNHIHLIGVPGHKAALAQALGQAHSCYAQLFNLRHNRGGHLWQDRFFSCALDDAQLVVAMRYVERNPVRAGLVQLAWDYSWSSAAVHVGRGDFSACWTWRLGASIGRHTIGERCYSRPRRKSSLSHCADALAPANHSAVRNSSVNWGKCVRGANIFSSSENGYPTLRLGDSPTTEGACGTPVGCHRVTERDDT